MRVSFISEILLWLIVVFALLCHSAVDAQAVAQGISKSPATEPYSLSYAAGGYDAQGDFLGGTELMNLAGFGGKLYAGVGYWMDQPRKFGSSDPKPGAQILVLDSSNARWRQEYVFDDRDAAGALKYVRLSTMEVVEFHRFDAAGNVLGPLAEMLMVGLDGNNGGVYTQKSPGKWEDTRIPTSTPIRSLAVHYDPTDRTEKLFAGTGGSQDRDLDRGIYWGVYDPSSPSGIRWDPTPERLGVQSRVMSMAECDGALFAAAKPSIFRRNDGQKSWEAVHSYPMTDSFDQTKYVSGFRGLTSIAGPDGTKALLSGFEGVAGDIFRIDPHTGAAILELGTRQFLTQQWGYPPAKRDIIPGYNDIPLVKSGSSEIRLLGLDTHSPKANKENSAWFLSRTTGNPPRYEFHEVDAPVKWPYNRSDGALWSIRTIIVSPFPEDQKQVLYLGGYDGHFKPDHNTAWLYRVGIDAALAR